MRSWCAGWGSNNSWPFTTVCGTASRPLTSVNSPDDDGVTALTPGLANPSLYYLTLNSPTDLSPSWNAGIYANIWFDTFGTLAQSVHSLNKYKWHFPTRNVAVGDVVILQDPTMPTKWPLARVIAVHPGSDKLVHVVTVKTPQGTYKRPVSKVAVLIPNESESDWTWKLYLNTERLNIWLSLLLMLLCSFILL